MYDFTLISVGTQRQGDISRVGLQSYILVPVLGVISVLINIEMVAPSLDIPPSLSLMVPGSYLLVPCILNHNLFETKTSKIFRVVNI